MYGTQSQLTSVELFIRGYLLGVEELKESQPLQVVVKVKERYRKLLGFGAAENILLNALRAAFFGDRGPEEQGYLSAVLPPTELLSSKVRRVKKMRVRQYMHA